MSTAIIITGANGFIGSHLLSQLTGQSTYKTFCFKPQMHSDGKYYLKSELTSFFASLPKAHQYILIHLAGINSVQQAEANPDACIHSNFTFVKDLIDLSQTINIKKILFSSTVQVYENHLERNFEDSKIVPKNMYTKTKIDSENLLMTSQVPSIVIRLSNTYGPRGNGVINKLIMQALTERSLKITNPNESRDFIYIDDVLSAILNFIENDIPTNIFNVASGRSTSIQDIANLIKATIPDLKISVENISKERASPFQINNDKIMKLFNWNTKIDLASGIQRTVEYYQSREFI